MELSAKYNPTEVEDKWYKYWMDKGFFHSTPDNREPYCIVIPPPNVTGVLHMGHMLNNTIQDVLVRRARMKGKNACWVPGTDHASIATEAKVVAKLKAEGIEKSSLTREQFLKYAWEWKEKHGGIILEQLKKLGASCDWERTAFTMDEIRSKSVINVFCDLFRKGLIYRGVRMVNWDPKALTALSDEEVVFKEHHGKLYYLRYKIEGEDGYAVVATTRPETIMGDTAMCINPNDPKNQHLKGKKVIVPLVNRVIPVIEDEYVDIEFGTGCLKVTPAHDVNDYMIGEKYNLPSIDIFNDDGTLSEAAGLYVGMDRFDVREQIEKDLLAANLMEKVEPYTNKVGFSERTNVPIEPKLSMQWFMRMAEIAKPATDCIKDEDIKFYPQKYRNTYLHWMENIKDWCISRQLWWGHQIPAYYLPKGGYVVAKSKEEALNEAKKVADYPITIDDLRQDPDCLDTWFSSWLWPIALFDGINNPNNKEISYYYPTSDLITAPDIIFFWVARMIMAGYQYEGKMPFHNVYFTGIVRDKQGRKMSKSLGNSPDPLELIDRYGADGVRMGMLLCSPAGGDLLFDESLTEQGRNFCNKIWNAFRLVMGWQVDQNIPQPEVAKTGIEWFNNTINKAIEQIDDDFSKYRISEALMNVYKLFWDEFSSWFLEIIKPAFGQPIDGKTYGEVLAIFEKMLQLLHPFMPFITEELWQQLRQRNNGESIMVSAMPSSNGFDQNLINDFERVKEVISGIRTTRQDKNIAFKQSLNASIHGFKLNAGNEAILKKLAGLSNIDYVDAKVDGATSFMIGTSEIYVPLSGLINVEEERTKLQQELDYAKHFLESVQKKLSNEKFVNGAPEKVVELERKKQADALQKISTLEERIAALR